MNSRPRRVKFALVLNPALGKAACGTGLETGEEGL
jgi:hypothetical protein